MVTISDLIRPLTSPLALEQLQHGLDMSQLQPLDVNACASDCLSFLSDSRATPIIIAGIEQQNIFTQWSTHQQQAKLNGGKLLVLCEAQTIAEHLLQTNIAVLASPLSSAQVFDRFFSEVVYQLAPMQNHHAVLLVVHGVGLLIKGPEGVGKSSLAWELLQRGHQLVADDLVEVQRMASGRLLGKAAKNAKGLLHLQAMGFIDVERQLGVASCLFQHEIHGQIMLHPRNSHGQHQEIRVRTDEPIEIQQIKIPQWILQRGHGNHLCSLVESCAKQILLEQAGWTIDSRLPQPSAK
ncbi:MAG: hypothetical protein OEY38_02915 [Gammaproteobacteria bacterium]|nr:hypothetical protein [Gammaproteobacteria bacterium]